MRLYVDLDEDLARALRHRALGERRSLRDQAAHELERALLDVFRPQAPPDIAHKSEAPGAWQGPPGAPRKGKR
jgi:hypothetical protein